MAPPTEPELLDAAVTILRKAGELTLQHFRHPELDIDRKDDGTPVTIADRDVERLVRDELERLFPDDGILGEEEAEKIGTSGRRWILDPIDGTKAFTHGVPLYTNLLALEDEHGIALGVINVPALGETVSAGRGLGCFANGAPCSVSSLPTLDGACVSTSGFNIWDDDAMLRVKRSGVQLRTWGDGYGYVLVATGRIEAMVDPVAELYDLAPMPIILAEAGGRFTSYAGDDGPGHGSGIATNGHVHEELRSLLTAELVLRRVLLTAVVTATLCAGAIVMLVGPAGATSDGDAPTTASSSDGAIVGVGVLLITVVAVIVVVRRSRRPQA